MAAITLANPIAGVGAGKVIPFAGAPSAGTDEVQTLTIDASGGTFKLSYDGEVTGAISWSSTNATLVSNVDTALEALPNIGSGGVAVAVGTMTSGVGTLTITFSGASVSKRAVSTIAVANNSLTGTATLSVAETTPGVNATFRNTQPGALINDTTNFKLYQRSGTSAVPTNVVVGGQS